MQIGRIKVHLPKMTEDQLNYLDPGLDFLFDRGLMLLSSPFPSPGNATGWAVECIGSDRRKYEVSGRGGVVRRVGSETPIGVSKPLLLQGLAGREARLSRRAQLAYLSGKEPEGDLAGYLTKSLSDYVYLDAPEDYSLLCAWIAGTYIFKLFPCFPILLIHSSSPGCGKSRMLQVLERLSFNAHRFNVYTESAVVRTAEAAPTTLLLDEADLLGREAVNDTRFIEILNSRYEADSQYYMSAQQGKDWTVRAFQLFGPTAYAKLNSGAVPRSLLSRSIPIEMEPLPPSVAERFFDHPRYSSRWGEMRDALYVWALCNWRAVFETYRNDTCVRLGTERLAEWEAA